MKHHQLTDELQEKAILYASGALDAAEREEYYRHLQDDNCAICRAEVLESEAAAQSLAMMLPLQTPSQAAKQGLLARAEAASLSGRTRPPVERSRPAFAWGGWLVAAAALVVLGVLINTNRGLREQVESLNALILPSTRVVNLVGQGGTPQARARIYWNEAGRTWRVLVKDLPAVPNDRAYQLWFVPTGTNPVSAKVFNTNASGSAEFEIPVPPEVTTLMAAAVTVEPAGGSPQPTSGFALMGATN
jgi:anti-sigma-K factor RskA